MRLIDADALIEIFDKDKYDRVRNEYQSGYNDGLLHAEVVADDLADDMPTVDAVPVIRCKDCKHWQCDDGESYCDELGIFGTDMNSYCSYAKRKEE